MDETADTSTLPVEFEKSLNPGHLPEVTFGDTYDMESCLKDTPSRTVSKSNIGRLSPVRGKTIKEYDQQISDLKKENFNLKMRIYYMEERMEQRYGDGQDVFKTNIELQVQAEKLKKDLADKHDLLQKAATAMETLTAKHQHAQEAIKSSVLSENMDKIKQLQAQLETANQECDKSRQAAERAKQDLVALQEDLREAREEIQETKKQKEEFSDKLSNAEFDVQHLTAQLKMAEQAKVERERENGSLNQRMKCLEEQLQDAKKETTRRDRDLQNLSCLLEQSHVDSLPVLQPIHRQDELEDAKEAIRRNTEKIGMLENELKDKDQLVGDLENALRGYEQKLKDSEAEWQKESQKSKRTLDRYKANLEDTLKSLGSVKKKADAKGVELMDANKQIERLNETLKEVEQDKAKSLSELARDLTEELEIDNRRLQRQLSEAEETIENLVKSLGKKEGELAGFQDQLARAMQALKDSDEAVEALHKQLQTERADFEHKMKEEASKHQAEAGQLSNDITALEKELKALRNEHQQSSSGHEVPQDLVVELRKLLEDLKKEMHSLSNLEKILAAMGKSGDTSSSAELLLTEITSVQKIYQQLEVGVEKNSELHQALLRSLQAGQEPPKSSQDGDHSLASVIPSTPGKSVTVATSPGLIPDRYLQPRTDRHIQTSPYISQADSTALNQTINSPGQQPPQQRFKFGDTPTTVGAISRSPGQRGRQSHVHFAENPRTELVNLQSTSLTDDAKGSSHHPQQLNNSSNEYFNFQQGVLFDEDNFDGGLRGHDRASSVRPDSRATACSLTHNDSECAEIPSANGPSAPTSSACNLIDDTPLPDKPNATKLPVIATSPHSRTSGSHLRTGHNSSLNDAKSVGKDQAVSNSDFPDSPSSFLAKDSPHKEVGGPVKRSPASYQLSSLLGDGQEQGAIAGEVLEDTEAPRSRRSSWAEELEQYRVHGQGQDIAALTNQENNDQHQEQTPRPAVLDNMTAVELRDLVAQLQVDLVDAIRHNKALQEELHTSSFKKPSMKGRPGPTSTHPTKPVSRIPVPQSSSASCLSTASEDSDCGDAHNTSPAAVTGKKVMNNTWAGQSSSAHQSGHQLSNGHTSWLGSGQGDGRASNLPRGKASATSVVAAPAALQIKLSESHAQIKNLESKLLATESTVRLLSKKNKAFQKALETAGIPTTGLDRSNSESCLTNLSGLSRAGSTSCLGSTDAGKRLAHLLSPMKTGRYCSSMERSRAAQAVPESTLDSTSAASRMTQSSVCWSPSRNTTADASSASDLAWVEQQSTMTESTQPTLVSNKINFKVPQVPAPVAASKPFHGTNTTSPTRQYNDGQKSPSKLNHRGLANNQPPSSSDKPGLANGDDCKGSPPKSSLGGFGSERQGSSTDRRNQSRVSLYQSGLDGISMLDVSAYPDVTYTSILEGSVLHRLQGVANMDKSSLSATATEDWAGLDADQLHGRLVHLERVNLTLREEISVYEAIHRSQGTQVTPSFCAEGSAGTDSDEDILRKHLEEIRKLRQRLERLDITKDPEQLLIFQSHTQQRIARQESMLAQVQQQLVEREEQHTRELAQLHHRLARDKAGAVDKLEHTLADLRRQLQGYTCEIKEKEEQLEQLRTELAQAGEREAEQEDIIKKVQAEKSEFEEDLVKRDRGFLETEKKMFRLEMAKESAESDCRRMEGAMRDRQKECERLEVEVKEKAKDLEECKENVGCLKEIVVKREKSLQEKIHSLQRLGAERVVMEQRLREAQSTLERLEGELQNARAQVADSHTKHRKETADLQSKIESLHTELRKFEGMEAKSAFQKAGYEAELVKLKEENLNQKSMFDREMDRERIELRQQIEELRRQVREKEELESEVNLLRARVKAVTELQAMVEQLQSDVKQRGSMEDKLRDRIKTLTESENEARCLQDRLERQEESLRGAEDSLRAMEEEKAKLSEDLAEKELKLKKRDKQLKNLISQHMKLEATFTKQKNVLKEKVDLLHSQKKQLRLFEVSLKCTSQEEKEDTMKQLLKELIATQRQVEELLSRLEHNPVSSQPAVRVETFGLAGVSSSGVTVMTVSGSGASSTSSGQDNVDTSVSARIGESSPERCLGSLSPCSSDKDLDLQPSSLLGGHTTGANSLSTACVTGQSSPLRPVSTNQSSDPPSLQSPVSPKSKHLRYWADMEAPPYTGTVPLGLVSSDLRSLFAVHKLESHEKLRKEAAEGLGILSNIESRLDDRLRTHKAKPVSESVDYSTLRETSLRCHNLRLCLEEVIKVSDTAWVTELPPIDTRGHFYDPVLAEQNEGLKRELTVLKSRYDILDHTVKEQQGRLNATTQHHRDWERSLYKQLHKTAEDMEQAKENFEVAGFIPSLKLRSPNKSPLRRMEDKL